MKLKSIIKDLKEISKIDDELRRILEDRYHEKTVGVIYNIALDYALSMAVGEDWRDWCDKVGNARDKNGRFITDKIFEAAYFNFSVKDLKKYVKLGNQVIEGKEDCNE